MTQDYQAYQDTVGIYEYAREVGHSVKHVYEQIRLGKIPAKKIGPRGVWQIPRTYLEQHLPKISPAGPEQ